MDLLWNLFEKSGSVEVYLKYKKREKNEFDSVTKNAPKPLNLSDTGVTRFF